MISVLSAGELQQRRRRIVGYPDTAGSAGGAQAFHQGDVEVLFDV
jgi:hypothetical protein